MSKPKIYGFINGGVGDWLEGVSLAEDGVCVAGHVSSSVSWAEHDLGPSFKKKEFDEHYPNGWEYEFVSPNEIDNHAGLQAALTRARERHAAKESA